MLLLYLLICFFFISVSSKQIYDSNDCSSGEFSPASQYKCNNSLTDSCRTFLVYRSRYDTVSEISSLFGASQEQVLHLNNLTDPSQALETSRDVIVPINCSCSDEFFQSNLSYMVPSGKTYSQIACEAFEGLVTLHTLSQANPFRDEIIREGGVPMTVPLKCACPAHDDSRDGFKYLVTYPFVEGDETIMLAKKFGIPPNDIWAANSLEQNPTVYPNTTVLVPLRAVPSINLSVKISNNSNPVFVPLNPTAIYRKTIKHRNWYVAGFVVGFFLMLVLVFRLGIYCRDSYKWKRMDHDSSSAARSSTLSSLSPDIITGMLKYSLISYSFEELREATRDFSEDTRAGASTHRGKLAGAEVLIKQMSFGDARRTVNIYSKINHTNIVILHGVCYGEADSSSSSYLVFEYGSHGCLRECLSNPHSVLPWDTRIQIALDVAIGLHYMHHCTIPSYIHMGINSRNIMITEGWRARIADFGANSVVKSSKERSDTVIPVDGWIAPEFLLRGSVSVKVDVFAFGVILLELVSAKEAKDGSLLMESPGFLRGGSESGCFEELRRFVDPCLEDYPIGEALCLVVLARACVEDDPSHRPSMDDILKILARMV